MRAMQRVMFVCTGNICRSPLAHAVFEHMLVERGLSDHYRVESSGLTGYHIGDNADPRMRRTARAHGVQLDHLSRRFQRNDLESYDILLAMDSGHYDDMTRLAGDDETRAKVHMFRSFDPHGDGDVPDPYYGGSKGFEDVYDIVERSCRVLLDELEGARRGGVS